MPVIILRKTYANIIRLYWSKMHRKPDLLLKDIKTTKMNYSKVLISHLVQTFRKQNQKKEKEKRRSLKNLKDFRKQLVQGFFRMDWI